MSFAAGFFGSLYDQAKTSQQAKADEARMRMMKNLDVEFQRSRRIVDRDGKKWELTFDGNGKEIPGLARELTPEESRKIQADDVKTQAGLIKDQDTVTNFSSDAARAREDASSLSEWQKKQRAHEEEMMPLNIAGKKASTENSRAYAAAAAAQADRYKQEAADRDPTTIAIDKALLTPVIQKMFTIKDDEGNVMPDFEAMDLAGKVARAELDKQGITNPGPEKVREILIKIYGSGGGKSTSTPSLQNYGAGILKQPYLK